MPDAGRKIEIFQAYGTDSETHPAAFRVHGIDWRWDFGCDERDTAYPFAFVIEPDGTGLYYNSRPSTDGTATPSDLFDCMMVT